MRKFLKISLIIFRSILIFIAIGAVTTASVKNASKTVRVEDFKKKGVYQEDISSNKVKYYKIESDEELPAFSKINQQILPGSPGDILVSTQATLINPLVSGLVSFFAGGHAAICLDSYSDFDITTNKNQTVEATGLGDGEMVASLFYKGYWTQPDPFTEVIGLRADISESQRKEVISLATSMLGDYYNYSFLFDTTNKKYCSDLVSVAYEKAGINLNKDSFTTNIYDIIVSKDVYISYYHYFDSNQVLHIYYLG